MPLSNLPENFLLDRLPAGLIDADLNNLIAQLIGGYQDRLGDLRAQGSTIERLYDPQNAPPVRLQAVQVSFLVAGNPTSRLLDVQDSTPTDPGALPAWAAAQMGVDPTTILSATLIQGDAIRDLEANALALLAQTIGAPVYSDTRVTAAQAVATQRQLIAGHFARLKIKGTPKAFDILARALGLDEVIFLPLWGRLSPRNPADIGDTANDADYSSTPDQFPSSTLPDPEGVYDPQVMDDGPFFAWTSGPLTVDPTRADYLLTAVNGANPFIRLAPSGTLAHPDPGSYYLLGGGVMARAAVTPPSGNFTIEALAEGGSFSADARDPNRPLSLKVVITRGALTDGTVTTTLSVTDRLSAIKYRTSLYDLVMLVDLDVYAASNRVPVEDNPNTLLTDGDGNPVLSSKPLTGGDLYAQPPTTALPAFPGYRQVDPTRLQQAALRASSHFETVRPASRFPRRVNSGFLLKETTSIYAPSNRVQVIANQLQDTQSSTSTATPSYGPNDYDVRFFLYLSGSATAIPMVAERGTTQNDANILYVKGNNVTGTYSLANHDVWSFQNTNAPRYHYRLEAHLTPVNTEFLDDEPSTHDKANGNVTYLDRPQDDLQFVGGISINDTEHSGEQGLFDEFPFRRELTFDGEDVDLNTYQPASPDEQVQAATRETHVEDENGIEYALTASVDADQSDQPPRVVFTPVNTIDDAGQPVNTPPSLPALAFANGKTYHVGLVHGVPVCSPNAFLRDEFENGLMAWLPCNEHPLDPLWVQDHTDFNVLTFAGQIQPGQRVWNSSRGWVLAAHPPAAGPLFSQQGYRGIGDTFSLAFFCHPFSINGASTLIQFGPFTLTMNAAVLSVNWRKVDGSIFTVAATNALPTNALSFVTVVRAPQVVNGATMDVLTLGTSLADGTSAHSYSGHVALGTLAGFDAPTVVNQDVVTTTRQTDAGIVSVATLPSTGIINDAGYGVLAGQTPWYRTLNSALNLPTDTVFTVEHDSVSGIATIVFGNGTHGALLGGGTVNVTYSVDSTFLSVMQGTAGVLLSDLRIWRVAKTADDFAWVRAPRLTPTPVLYSKRPVFDRSRNAALGFAPLSNGVVQVVPLGGPRPLQDHATVPPVFGPHQSGDAAPTVYPPPLPGQVSGDNPGRAYRYTGDGSYVGDDRFMQTGRSGDPALPAMDLDLTGHEVNADGEFIFSGDYALPDNNAVFAAKGPQATNGIDVSQSTPVLSGTNPVQRRVYVKGDDNQMYEVTLVADASGTRLQAALCPHSNSNEAPSDNETRFVRSNHQLGVNTSGDVYFKSAPGVTDSGPLLLLLEERTTLDIPFYTAPTVDNAYPPSILRTQLGSGLDQYRSTRWTEFNTESDGVDRAYLTTDPQAESRAAKLATIMDGLYTDPLARIQAATDDDGNPLPDLEYLLPASPGGGASVSLLNHTVSVEDTTEAQDPGNYRLELDLGIVGGSMTEGYVSAQVTLGQAATSGIGEGQTLRLLPTGPQRGTANVEFSLLGTLHEVPWTLTLDWYGERTLTSQQPGYGRRLAVYGYRMVKLVSEVYAVSLVNGSPQLIQQGVSVAPNGTNAVNVPGGWTGRLNSQGVSARWEHESTQYPASADPLDTASKSRVPVAAILAAATGQHREQLTLTPQVRAYPAPVLLPTFTLKLPTGALSEGTQAQFSVTPAGTVPANTAYVWTWWDGSTTTTRVPQVTKFLTGRGTMHVSVLIVGPEADTRSYSGDITVNGQPLINSTTLTRDGQSVTFAVNATDPEGNPLAYAWTLDSVRPCTLTEGSSEASFNDTSLTRDVAVNQPVTGAAVPVGTVVTGILPNGVTLSNPVTDTGNFLLNFSQPLPDTGAQVTFSTDGLDRLLSVTVVQTGGNGVPVTEGFFIPGLPLPALVHSGVVQYGNLVYSQATPAAAQAALLDGFQVSDPVYFSITARAGTPLTFNWQIGQLTGGVFTSLRDLGAGEGFNTGEADTSGSRLRLLPMTNVPTDSGLSTGTPLTSFTLRATVRSQDNGQARQGPDVYFMDYPVTATFKAAPVITAINQTLSSDAPTDGPPTLYTGDTGVFEVTTTDADASLLNVVWMFTANQYPSGQQFKPVFGRTVNLSLSPRSTDPNVAAFNALSYVTINGVQHPVSSAPLEALDNTILYGTVAVFDRFGNSAVRTMQGVTILDRPVPPSVSSIAPTSGLPGTLVTIQGADFTIQSTVSFNGLLAPGVTFVSGKILTVPVPVGASTGPLTVTTGGGSAVSTASFTPV